jgi:CMP-N,N'-diacetyllegionaminic acid synthase
MRILALIPARGGSKRVPRKNLRMLGGKPLITWSIEVAKEVPQICDILVSTDDQEIADVAKSSGALVPWLRPTGLSKDDSKSIDVALHALEWYESKNGKVDGLLLLQPTSPFRTQESVEKSIFLFNENFQRSVIAVSPVQDHPMWVLKRNGDHLVPFLEQNGLQRQSQDLEEALIVNGSLYLASPNEIRESRTFLGKEPVPLIIDSREEAIDIDTEWDFRLCEFLIAEKRKQEKNNIIPN